MLVVVNLYISTRVQVGYEIQSKQGGPLMKTLLHGATGGQKVHGTPLMSDIWGHCTEFSVSLSFAIVSG